MWNLFLFQGGNDGMMKDERKKEGKIYSAVICMCGYQELESGIEF